MLAHGSNGSGWSSIILIQIISDSLPIQILLVFKMIWFWIFCKITTGSTRSVGSVSQHYIKYKSKSFSNFSGDDIGRFSLYFLKFWVDWAKVCSLNIHTSSNIYIEFIVKFIIWIKIACQQLSLLNLNCETVSNI